MSKMIDSFPSIKRITLFLSIIISYFGYISTRIIVKSPKDLAHQFHSNLIIFTSLIYNANSIVNLYSKNKILTFL